MKSQITLATIAAKLSADSAATLERMQGALILERNMPNLAKISSMLIELGYNAKVEEGKIDRLIIEGVKTKFFTSKHGQFEQIKSANALLKRIVKDQKAEAILVEQLKELRAKMDEAQAAAEQAAALTAEQQTEIAKAQLYPETAAEVTAALVKVFGFINAAVEPVLENLTYLEYRVYKQEKAKHEEREQDARLQRAAEASFAACEAYAIAQHYAAEAEQQAAAEQAAAIKVQDLETTIQIADGECQLVPTGTTTMRTYCDGAFIGYIQPVRVFVVPRNSKQGDALPSHIEGYIASSVEREYIGKYDTLREACIALAGEQPFEQYAQPTGGQYSPELYADYAARVLYAYAQSENTPEITEVADAILYDAHNATKLLYKQAAQLADSSTLQKFYMAVVKTASRFARIDVSPADMRMATTALQALAAELLASSKQAEHLLGACAARQILRAMQRTPQ